MKALPSVTLIGIDTVNPDRTSRILSHCANLLNFGAAILYTDRAPSVAHEHEVRIIPPVDHAGVQRWELSQLAQAFDTDFCLCVQHDGWILNPERWTDEFLAWDFIGAPWPLSLGSQVRVGNSGLSLRSKAFCQATAAYAHEYAEEGYDVFACKTMGDRFKAIGLRYAPLEIAGRFSWEHYCEDVEAGPATSFGFHGWCHGKTAADYNRFLTVGPDGKPLSNSRKAGDQLYAADVASTLAAVCQNVSTDVNGRVTLHELTDQLNVPHLPARAARLFAVFGLVKLTPGALLGNRIEIVDQAGIVIAAVNMPDILFPTDQLAQRIFANLNGVIWPREGRYVIRLVARDRIVSLTPFSVTRAQASMVPRGS
jgi:hypothetical protein